MIKILFVSCCSPLPFSLYFTCNIVPPLFLFISPSSFLLSFLLSVLSHVLFPHSFHLLSSFSSSSYSPSGECVTGDIRLVNGSVPTEGRLEVCYGGVWGTITSINFDHNDARVACRQLGYDSDCKGCIHVCTCTPSCIDKTADCDSYDVVSNS